MSEFENLINAELLETFKNEQDKELAPKGHTHTASDITDLQTIKGDKGDTGPQGPQGEIGPQGATGGTGATGNGVSSIEIRYATSTSNTTAPSTWYTSVQSAAAGAYLWTRVRFYYTNGTYSSPYYTVARQGANGNSVTGQRGSQWFSGTAMSGTSTTTGAYTWSDSTYKYVGDYYLNTTYGYVYQCTTAGSGTTAKWTYKGSIRGEKGEQGDTPDISTLIYNVFSKIKGNFPKKNVTYSWSTCYCSSSDLGLNNLGELEGSIYFFPTQEDYADTLADNDDDGRVHWIYFKPNGANTAVDKGESALIWFADKEQQKAVVLFKW